MNQYLNPYTDQNFFTFFWVFAQRVWGFFSGEISFSSLSSDELQVFVLVGVSASSALVGTFLILRKMTMLANALSHTILLGIAVVYLLFASLSFPLLLLAALATGALTTFLTDFLVRVVKLQKDASIGLVFNLLFALGILLVSLFCRNTHLGTELIMGNVDALQKSDLSLVFTILGINLSLILLLFPGYTLTTFDPKLARSFGISPTFFQYLLMVQTSFTAIGAFRAVGVIMVLSFIVAPPLTARLFTHTLSTLLWLSVGIGSLASFIGVALSRHIFTYFGVGLSTGGIVVTLLALFYILALLFTRLRLQLAQASLSPQQKTRSPQEIQEQM
ncbi:MAG: Manganese transport system membrane protein MntB [Chlamydiae bacterium]|nr:Manganese transport system membrane protein MntB [Chlamydiota bacterium]